MQFLDSFTRVCKEEGKLHGLGLLLQPLRGTAAAGCLLPTGETMLGWRQTQGCSRQNIPCRHWAVG